MLALSPAHCWAPIALRQAERRIHRMGHILPGGSANNGAKHDSVSSQLANRRRLKLGTEDATKELAAQDVLGAPPGMTSCVGVVSMENNSAKPKGS